MWGIPFFSFNSLVTVNDLHFNCLLVLREITTLEFVNAISSIVDEIEKEEEAQRLIHGSTSDRGLTISTISIKESLEK